MSKSDVFEADLLKLVFHAVGIAGIADNAAAGAATSLYVSLHTADPAEGGTQTSSEATYTGYARVAVPRTAAAWPITANSITAAAAASFPQATGGTNTITHYGIGTLASGAGKLLYKGPVTPNIAVSTQVTPAVTPTVTED